MGQTGGAVGVFGCPLGAMQRSMTEEAGTQLRVPRPGGVLLRASPVPPSPLLCPCRAALISWGVISVLGGAFVCGQSAALAVLGLLR